MPRRIPNQVTQTVSRLLEGGYLKRPPAWYNPTIQHPPAPERPRQATQRPDSDLPRSLQSTSVQAQRLREATSTRGRSSMNSKKKAHTQLPNLRAQPIVYDADRVQRQFFRDHPWEAKRPVTMVEMDYTLQEQPEPAIPQGAEPELHYWSRMNPSVEDVVECTLRTHRDCHMSLAQAYQRTVAAYHAIQAERETRIRYANLEARSLGGDLGPSQTDRGFTKEDRWLAEWAPEQAADLPIQVAGGASPACLLYTSDAADE